MNVLRHVGDEPRPLTLREPENIYAVKQDRSAFGRINAENVFKERCLPRTVFPEQYTYFTVAEFKVYSVQHGLGVLAVTKAQVFYLQH